MQTLEDAHVHPSHKAAHRRIVGGGPAPKRAMPKTPRKSRKSGALHVRYSRRDLPPPIIRRASPLHAEGDVQHPSVHASSLNGVCMSAYANQVSAGALLGGNSGVSSFAFEPHLYTV